MVTLEGVDSFAAAFEASATVVSLEAATGSVTEAASVPVFSRACAGTDRMMEGSWFAVMRMSSMAMPSVEMGKLSYWLNRILNVEL
jgi:hypothetical protein